MNEKTIISTSYPFIDRFAAGCLALFLKSVETALQINFNSAVSPGDLELAISRILQVQPTFDTNREQLFKLLDGSRSRCHHRLRVDNTT